MYLKKIWLKRIWTQIKYQEDKIKLNNESAKKFIEEAQDIHARKYKINPWAWEIEEKAKKISSSKERKAVKKVIYVWHT